VIDKISTCFYTTGKIGEVETEFLIDTGSTYTILDVELYNRLPENSKPILRECNLVLRGASREKLRVHGEIILPLEFGGKTFKTSIKIVTLNDRLAILGLDFMQKEKCLVDVASQVLHIRSNRVKLPLFKQEDNLCARVQLCTDIKIAPREEMMVAGEIGKRNNQKILDLGVVEENDTLQKNTGLMLASALVSKVENKIPVRLANFTEKTISLTKGYTIGKIRAITAEQIVEVDESEDGVVRAVSGELSSADVEELPDHLKSLVEEVDKSLCESETDKIKNLLSEYRDSFMTPDGKLGQTDLITHKIDVGNARPIRQRTRIPPMHMQKQVDSEINKLLEQGIIEKSSSPWCSPLVAVPKSDGKSIRLCVDFRRINTLMINKDSYPLPKIESCLNSLSGARYYSTLDLAQGYHQVVLDPESRDKTAFGTRAGLFQYRVLPFGLQNAPGAFERLMELVLQGLQWHTAVLYLDDIIVYGKTFDEAYENLEEVFGRLKKANLTLKPSKCRLFQTSVQYLGHVVSQEGVKCDPKKVEAVEKWDRPESVKEARQFLGFAQYYRKFIKGFSEIASPLYDLTKKNSKFIWTEKCEKSFNTLKDKLISAPVLAYPTKDDAFILDTDASLSSVGAVLSQVQDGVERPISYASKTLSKTQRNYCTTMRELLAAVIFVKHFHHYLWGKKFILRTDHASLTWLTNFKEPEGMLARWLSILGSYQMELIHRAGKEHSNADGLSRSNIRPCKRNDCEQCALKKGDCVCMITRSRGKLLQDSKGVTLRSGRKLEAVSISDQSQSKNRDTTACQENLSVDTNTERCFKEKSASSKTKACLQENLSGSENEEGSTDDDSSEESDENTTGLDSKLKLDSRKKITVKEDASSSDEDSGEDDSVTMSDPVLEAGELVDRSSSPVDAGADVQTENKTDKVTVDSKNTESNNSGESDQFSVREAERKQSKIPEKARKKNITPVTSNWVDSWQKDEIRVFQIEDKVVGEMIQLKQTFTERPRKSEIDRSSNEMRTLWLQWDNLEVHDGILYRRWIPINRGEKEHLQIVVPINLRKEILHELHNHKNSGHLGIAKTLGKLRQRFYWPNHKADIIRWCKHCKVCQSVNDRLNPKRAPLKQHLVYRKMDRIAVDIAGPIPMSDKNNCYILVVCDYFTKFSEAYALPDITAQTVADVLSAEWIARYGAPVIIHSDQGRNFESELFKELCKMWDIKKTRTARYRPNSNGLVEKQNRTLKKLLRSYVEENPSVWDDHLPYITMAYRATIHESTKCSPNLLMFGEEIRLPTDLMYNDVTLEEDVPACPSAYVEWLRETTRTVFRKAQSCLKQSAERQKRNYDKNTCLRKFAIGQFVWILCPRFLRGKLGRGWRGPFLIVKKLNDLNYIVQENRDARKITLHVDHIKEYTHEVPEIWIEL
jgi:hypothetical protein